MEISLLLKRFDLDRYLAEFPSTSAGSSEVMLVCPLCREEKLSVNRKTGQWRCFRCNRFAVNPFGKKVATAGAGGLLRLVKLLEGLTTAQAIERMEQFVSRASGSPTEIPDAGFLSGSERVELFPTGLPKDCVAVDGILPYMAKRRISLEDAKLFGLGWCATGWTANRLIFPVWERGQCIFWQARAMWEKAEHVPRPRRRRDGSLDKDAYRKTINPKAQRDGVHYYGAADVVYNLEQAARYPRVAICEGPTSAIRVGPSAVGTFGKALNLAQIARMVRAGVRAVDFMWDGPSPKEPEGAWPSMVPAAYQLAPFMDVRLVFLPRGDPGDYTREENAYMRSHAVPLGHETSFI